MMTNFVFLSKAVDTIQYVKELRQNVVDYISLWWVTYTTDLECLKKKPNIYIGIRYCNRKF